MGGVAVSRAELAKHTGSNFRYRISDDLNSIHNIFDP